MPETSQIGRKTSATLLDHRPPAPFARTAPLPTGSVGGNRHEPALNVSAPADIQGGDAVAEERPSGVSDALSVRREDVAFLKFGSLAAERTDTDWPCHNAPRLFRFVHLLP